MLIFGLLYGTDPNLGATTTASSAPGPFNFNWPQFKLSIALPLAILLSLLMLIRSGRAKRFWRPVRVGLCIGIFALQASCGGGGGGGGGGGDDTSVPCDAEPDLTAPLFTNVVTDIYDTEYQVTDLQPDTRYYWKIVAVDNFGKHIVSLTHGFTTFCN